jgi:hypothetical protein
VRKISVVSARQSHITSEKLAKNLKIIKRQVNADTATQKLKELLHLSSQLLETCADSSLVSNL